MMAEIPAAGGTERLPKDVLAGFFMSLGRKRPLSLLFSSSESHCEKKGSGSVWPKAIFTLNTSEYGFQPKIVEHIQTWGDAQATVKMAFGQKARVTDPLPYFFGVLKSLLEKLQ